jgi:Protein of unknown function (DUF2934)
MFSERARIAARAYELWVQRGRPIGSPEVDWDAAEKQLLAAPTDPTRPNATLDSLQQQVANVLTSDSDRGPVATATVAPPPDGPTPKRPRASRNSGRPRDNGAPRK